MDVAELEKAFKNLGAELVTTREELKALKESPRADPKELKTLRDDLEGLKKGWDEMLTKLTKGPDKPPEPKPEPTPDTTAARGFGFFRFFPPSSK